MVYRYLPLSDKQGILDTACLCVVLTRTLPGITLSDSAYRPFPPVDNYLLEIDGDDPCFRGSDGLWFA